MLHENQHNWGTELKDAEALFSCREELADNSGFITTNKSKMTEMTFSDLIVSLNISRRNTHQSSFK